jgi:DNA-binding response OmpR family regulator
MSATAVAADFERAGRELRQSALGLAQAWQALQKAGWSAAQMRPVLLALRQLSKGCDRLRLLSLRKRTHDLETLLIPFVSAIQPKADQAKTVEAQVSALTSAVLAFDLSKAAQQYSLKAAANDDDETISVKSAPAPEKTASAAPIAAPTRPRLSEPNTVLVLRADKDLGAGLVDTLKERGHKVIELGTTQALEIHLQQQLPGAVIADARFLNGISRQLQALKARANTAERDAAVVVISDRKDLGRKLLATRHGAHGYFEAPIDVLAVAASLGLSPPQALKEPTHRALLCTSNTAFAEQCAQWLLGLNIATRIEANAIGALAACLEFTPEILLIDASVASTDALRVVAELRKQSQHQHLPIVLFAGSNSLQQREDAIAAGADEYLIEPMRQRHVQSVVSARLQRLSRMKVSTAKSAHGGLLTRQEFIRTWQQHDGLSLVFVLIDQFGKLDASYPVSAFEQLDTAMAGLLKPRLSGKEFAGYFQDGQYMLAVRAKSDADLDDLSDKIRRSIEHSRISLTQRVDNQERLSASIAWTRAPIIDLEQGLHAVRHTARVISEMGGNRSQSTQESELMQPRQASARADVPSNTLMQPVLPLSAKLHGQYWLHFVWDDATGLLTDYRTVAAMAKAAGSAQEFDRRLLALTLARRAEELKAGRQLRLLLELGEPFLHDDNIFNWLSNQLNTLRLSGSGISIFVNFESVLAHHSAWQKRYQEFHSIGMRLGLIFDGKSADDVRNDAIKLGEMLKLNFDFALLPAARMVPEHNDAELDHFEAWGLLLKRVRERGAVSIVRDAENRTQIDWLRALRIDFALSENLAPSTASAQFDFSSFQRA